MTRDEMMGLLRKLLSDEQGVGWSMEPELMAYLDQASDNLSEQLIADKDPTLMKRLSIAGPTPLPNDFVAFVGNVPVDVVGRECESEADTEALYWAKFPLPSSAASGDEELSYTRQQALMVVDIARIHALNKNEYNVTQDLTLLGDLKGAIAAARSARRGE